MNNIIKKDLEEIFSKNIDWKLFDNAAVLITGAYGMLASYLTLMLIYLREEKEIRVNIIALVRSKEKFKRKFQEYADKEYIEIYETNLLEPVYIDEKIDYIVHAASLANPNYYATSPIDVLTPNIIGNYHLLNLATQKNVKAYLLFSTGDVYGSVDGVKTITEDTIGKMDPLDLHSCYGESKRMAETMCLSFYVQNKVPVKIARIAHTYAPTMDIENDPRVFASFVADIINNRDIVMLSDGCAKRPFCYITDAIYAFIKILLDGKSGEAYNVCNQKEFMSIFDLANRLVSIYPERKLKVVRKQRNKADNYLENTTIKNLEISISNEKLKDLGWNESVSVDDGFKRVIDYIENEKWDDNKEIYRN